MHLPRLKRTKLKIGINYHKDNHLLKILRSNEEWSNSKSKRNGNYCHYIVSYSLLPTNNYVGISEWFTDYRNPLGYSTWIDSQGIANSLEVDQDSWLYRRILHYVYIPLIKFSSQSSWSITSAPGHNSDSTINSGERLVLPMTTELRRKLSCSRLYWRRCTCVHYVARLPRNASTIRISNLYDRFIILISLDR